MKRVTSEGCSAERRRETDGSVAVTRALDSVRKQNISYIKTVLIFIE